MKLSRTVAYAIQATLQLAEIRSSGPVPCSRLATAGNMPERFLLQVLRSLVTHGVLQSTRGVEGGYRLDRDPREISLLEVIEAIEGPLVTELPLHEGLSESTYRRLSGALSEANTRFRKDLDRIKIADLLPGK
jgi:Rrf2 family protein